MALPPAGGSGGANQGARLLPAFLESTRADIHAKWADLYWDERQRLAPSSDPNAESEWARIPAEPQDEIWSRNRYTDIGPFAKNRVRLRVPEGKQDYINASHISLNSSKGGHVRRYIATQGPLKAHYNDFWAMVWQESLSKNSTTTANNGVQTPTAIVIMLTETHEAGREKCFQYFPRDMTAPNMPLVLNTSNDPPNNSIPNPVANIWLLSEPVYDVPTRSTIRRLRMTIGLATLDVTHYLFSGWPDYGVPEGEDRVALLNLARTSDSSAQNEAPRIVHCSAGVGRSGTFIALDHLLHELADGTLDEVSHDRDAIVETVDALRRQRMMMVQGEPQFAFLYSLLGQLWKERHGLPQ